MKISSASKKVLASALSAAMVVAFAPAVAFATPGDIKVTLDADNGTVTGTADFPYAEQNHAITLPKIVKDGVQGVWGYDADGNGEYTDTGDQIIAGDGTGTITLPAKTAITLKAFYEQPGVGDVTVDNSGKLSATVKASKLTALTGYSVVFYNADGTPEAAQSLTLSKGTDATATATADATAGQWTVSVVDAKGNEVAYKKVDVCKVKVGSDTKYAVKGSSITLTSGKAYTKGTDKETLYTGTYTVNGDATLDEAAVGTEYAAVTSSGKLTGKALTFSVSALAAASSGTADKSEAVLTVTGDNGASYSETINCTSAVSANGAKTITFDQKASGSRFSSDIAAGTYTVKLVRTDSKDGVAVKTTTTKTSFTISKVAFDANGGTFKGGYADNKADYYMVNASESAALPTLTADTDITVPEGKAIDGWSVNGSKVSGNTADLAVAGTTTVAVNYKDAAAETKCEKPAVESASYDETTGKWTVKLSAATANSVIYAAASSTALGADALKVAANKYDATKGIVTEDTNAIYAVAAAVSGATERSQDSDVVTLVSKSGQFTDFTRTVKGSQSELEKYIGKSSTDKWLANADVKAAIDAGNKTLKETGYATAKAWGKAEVAATKAVFEATVKAAKAELAKYEGETLVIVGDSAYSVKAADLKTATDGVASVEAAAAKYTTAAQFSAAVKNVVTFANGAIKGKAVKSASSAADIKAAQDVTASLQAAKDADAAKAALEAYNKLTDDQKKLVATADVAAAQKVVSDAEAKAALVNAQDLAAARDLNGKKVTAKAKVGKKAQGKSFTYALAASESGATASYAKVSGSKYIKISSTGKVTFSKVKVQKKAKTYKAKVSVTYGTQTVTKTVQLVVKKK